MSELKDFQFKSSYWLADIIESAVEDETELFNFNKDYFIENSSKFSKETILHQYIVCEALNHHERYFFNYGDSFEEEMLEIWFDRFEAYSNQINEFDINLNGDTYQWFISNHELFYNLFDNMGNEAYHILFANRNFLLKFNNLIVNTVKEVNYSSDLLNSKGTIRRTNIPIWVKKAVFKRDSGRCVFCNTDLTGLINNLVNCNYDHIVPLDKYGINDPCNIQLSCEKCNKSKTNKEGNTTKKYFSWW